jgi:hypothetical protein
MAMILETTLSTEFIPGTNLTGGLASADWRFLLPSQELGDILCIGIPSVPALMVISKIGQRIHLASTHKSKLQKIEKGCRENSIANVRTFHVEEFSHLPFNERSIDLVFLAGSVGGAEYIREAEIRSQLTKLLKVDGVIYFEIEGMGQRFSSRKSLKALLRQGFHIQGNYWLTPFSGEFRTALPLTDKEVSRYFFSNVLYGQSFKKRTLSRVGDMLSQIGVMGFIAPHYAVLLERNPGNGSAANGKFVKIPQYIRSIAAKAGIDLSHYTFGLSARGKFNANKVIFFLFDRSTRQAEVVIKMTRSSEFNQRLENEFRILSKLKAGEYVEPDTYPEPLFFDYHNGLAMTAIKAVHGKPFRTCTEATFNCPLAADAIDWIIQLGTASANSNIAVAKDVAEALHKLYQSFENIYPLTKREKFFLTELLDSVAQNEKPFPLVFQHGDPGTWNMMVENRTGRVIVIDWEAGEPEGLPLWDLFYFYRTYASWVSRQQGSRNPIKNFTENFLTQSEQVINLAKITERYSANVGLERKMIKPLFYTCWMHRALKESTRLKAEALHTGHYFNVLRLSIEQQNNPALKTLFQSL